MKAAASTGSNAGIEWLVDAAAVLAVWMGALVAENVAIGLLFRDQFSGVWELGLARQMVVPLATAGLAPVACAVAGGWRLATSAVRTAGHGGLTPSARRGRYVAQATLAVVGALAAGWLALGLSEGRHFASLALRVPFVALGAASGAAFGAWIVPRIASLLRLPTVLGILGAVVAVSAWLGDEYVLPRLYPAFHTALGAVTLLGASLVAFASRADLLPPGRWSRIGAALIGALLLVQLTKVGPARDALGRASNLRLVLVERAPLLGGAVAVLARMKPIEADAEASLAPPPAPDEVARSLDWTRRDWLLLTIDALRADHVSAYGYPRPTTPNIDALAREGALFEAAYCPTPHTSYSVTSLMTGKYLRPLLTLGLGQDSETWAQYFRQYGFRTAAFYPPAVFFIDQNKFGTFEESHLGFEYAKVEFADPVLRERQVAEYLATAPTDRSLFLWVHFFEPHEPYVMHPEHPFAGGPSADVDAYDSEVATADDGVGRLVRLFREKRPGAVVVVTADHGEEFGDHGGRYHGTTVYEEQVRVPLVVAGQGVAAGTRIRSVVQTIDLLPTALSALGIPRPARIRGRDLGPLLVGVGTGVSAGSSAGPPPPSAPDEAGFAFAETDDYALAAAGPERLVCERRAAACALYDVTPDPQERHDLASQQPARVAALRSLLRATERDHGRYELAGGPSWPEALRRGLQGEADAALDVASLLDDANPAMRRKAAEVSFSLHAPAAASAVKRAFDRDEDDRVRRWSALALVRMGEPAPPLADALLHDPASAWRRAAALSLGERGDARACDELAAQWNEVAPGMARDDADGEPPQIAMDLARAEELLVATSAAHCRAAVPALVRALGDVRARPYVADALGALGDDRARAPLLALLAKEPYVTTRPHEARALLALRRPSPALNANGTADVDARMAAIHSRLVVLLSDGQASVQASLGDEPAAPVQGEGEVRTFDLPAGADAPGTPHAPRGPGTLPLAIRASSGTVLAFWLAAPPPPARAPETHGNAARLIDRP
ncbi:MAG TPA: sulfatase [Polyangiaceae bacterium]|nr:sulfatase [Polyangiaceae bacterium]